MRIFRILVSVVLVGTLASCGFSSGMSSDEICRGTLEAITEGTSITSNLASGYQLSNTKLNALLAKIDNLKANTNDKAVKSYLTKLSQDYSDLRDPQKLEAAALLLVWDAVKIPTVCAKS